MKNLLIILMITFSLPLYGNTYTGYGKSRFNKEVAKFQAYESIKSQFTEDSNVGLKYYSHVEYDQDTVGNVSVEYHSETYCNSTFNGTELTGIKSTHKWYDSVLTCKETYSFEDNEHYCQLICDTNDEEIANLNDKEKTLSNHKSKEVCETYFTNIFIENGKTTTQTGVIYGNITFKEYYDRGGEFKKLPDGTYQGFYNELRNTY